MLGLKSSRQKRSSSATSKYKNHPLATQDINISHLCAHPKKNKPGHFGNKVLGKQNKKRVIGTEFPLQAIKFKHIENDPRRTAKQQWEQAKLLDKYSFQNQNPKEQNHSIAIKDPEITFFKDQPNNQPPLHREVIWKSLPAKTQKDYLTRFKQAIDKIFKGLDIFNRGTISQTNINKWIPEEALYFLGDVFQNIRQERLHLSQQQFQTKCLPILYQASEEDIVHFLESVNGKDYIHTVSINSEQKDKESMVEMRIGQGDQPKERVNQFDNKKYLPLIPFQEIIGNIKQQQKNISLRLTAQKQYQTMKQMKGGNQSSKVEWCKHSNLNTIKGESNTVSGFQSEKKDRGRRNQDDLPYFNFQVPQKRVTLPEKEDVKLNHQLIVATKIIDQPYIGNVANNGFNDNQGVSRPKTSRIIHQKVPKESLLQIQTQRNSTADTDKLDRLSSRLEEYIKFNKTKIEKHRNFIRENSAPKATQ